MIGVIAAVLASVVLPVVLPVVYQIPEQNLSHFRTKIDALIRRAVKLKFPAPSYKVGAPHEISRTTLDLDGSTYTEWFTIFDVTVEGVAPCFSGWRFHSTVDYEEGSASVIFRTVRGSSPVPERFRTLGSICEHCKTKRRRSAVYLLAHDDGRVIQVGKSCLKDFLGHASPDNIAAVAELIMELAGGMGAEESLGGHAGSPDSKTYLAFVALEIRKHGWLSKSKTMDEQSSTSCAAMGRLFDHTKAARDRTSAKTEKPSDDDRARAATALEWARGISPDSDYLHNLKAAASREGVGKNAGLIASIIPAWDRMMAATRERPVTEFVGVVGARLKGLRLTVDKVIPIMGGEWGDSSLHVMVDAGGNKLTWKSSTKTLETGSTYTVTGTVKKHDDSKYGKQTVLSRCVVELVGFEVDEGAARLAA